MPEDMILFARTFDLLDWLMPRLESFPRAYRHNVVRRLGDAALDFQEHLFDAKVRSGNPRINALHAADAALQKIRLYLRLAHKWRWLSDGQYQHVSRLVQELGRMLGGWLKQSHSRKR